MVRIHVDGLDHVLAGLKAIDVDVKTMRRELRPARRVLTKAIRLETPKRQRLLVGTVRSSVPKSLRIEAGIGNRRRPYAKWQNWAKKSPNRYFINRALYGHGTPKKLEAAIAAAVQKIIIKHRMK